MGLKCYSAALCPIQGKRLHARVNLHGFFLHQATHSWWEDRTPTLGRPGRLNLKGTILDQRKGSERNVKGHKTLPTYPKLLTVALMSWPFLCRPQSTCVTVRSCSSPVSLLILLGNNQEETPGVSWLLHTFFMHRGAPSPYRTFFYCCNLDEKSS